VSLKDIQANWDAYGRTDPLWAILTYPEKKGGGWELEEFLEMGRVEISRVMRKAEFLPVKFKRKRALDFGCGVGRTTQALCEHFRSCDGVDIAPSMIKLANEYNRHGKRCRYHVNDRADLSLFEDGSFDFVYSIFVLQHMAPEYSRVYMREFVRVLKAGGLVVFQLPSSLMRTASNCIDPLPDCGFAAEVRLEDVPREVEAGERIAVKLTVKNASTVTWPGSEGALLQIVQGGNHWLDSEGRLVVADDGRTPLRDALVPGEETELALNIQAPAVSGEYLLEVDMVQEGVAWFKEKGSVAARERVRVVAVEKAVTEKGGVGLSSEGQGIMEREKTVMSPRMEMHGIPTAEVTRLLEKAGGEVVAVEQDDVVALPWINCMYFVSK